MEKTKGQVDVAQIVLIINDFFLSFAEIKAKNKKKKKKKSERNQFNSILRW